MLGSKNTMPLDPRSGSVYIDSGTGDFFATDQISGSVVYKFHLNADNSVTPDGSIAGGDNYAIAGDPMTGYLTITSGAMLELPNWGAFWFGITGWLGGGFAGYVQDQLKAMPDVAVDDHYGCIPETEQNRDICFDETQSAPPALPTSTIGSEPWTATMSDVCGSATGENDVFTWTRGDATLWRAAVPSMNVNGFVTVSGITDADTILSKASSTATAIGGWHQALVPIGIAACTAAVLTPTEDGGGNLISVLLRFKADTMKALGNQPVSLPGLPYRVVPRQTNGSVVVLYWDFGSSQTMILSVDLASGNTTPLAATTSMVAAGAAVTPDGTHLLVYQDGQVASLSITQ